MTILYGTGFEAGSKEIIASADANDYSNIGVSTSDVHTGGYRLNLATGGAATNWVRFAASGSNDELWASVFLKPSGLGKSFQIEFELNDGTLVGVRKPTGVGNTNMEAYVDGSMVGTAGTFDLSTGVYYLFELHVLVANTNGKIQLKINGNTDIDYTGDTQPGATSAIDYLRLTIVTVSADLSRVDDITIRDDDWAGDIRYISQVPDGDDTANWTPSTGMDNYALVDEIAPSDSDYVESSTDTQQDLYTFDDYTQNNSIAHVVQWVRGKTDTNGGEIVMQCKSGATTSEESTSGLGTSFEYHSRILETDPDTATDWTVTGFNAALFGQEASVSGHTLQVSQHIVETAFDQNATFVTRPLAIDVDNEDGTRVWVTSWDDGTLYFKRKASDLSSGFVLSFGAATEAEVDGRTYFIVPYAPAFFGTADFGNQVYVYGRWDETGTAKHIYKSTDGGSSFSDIGDASWTTERVGAFWAEDTNTLYAITNEGSGNASLWESTDGGSSWSDISTPPAEVEFEAVSIHPDGRILIGNKDSGTPHGSYLDKTYSTSSWQDFSTMGGNGIVSIIWVV